MKPANIYCKGGVVHFVNTKQRDTTNQPAPTPADPKPKLEWPSIEAQQKYWEQRDRDLDKIESACAWFDEKDKPLPF